MVLFVLYFLFSFASEFPPFLILPSKRPKPPRDTATMRKSSCYHLLALVLTYASSNAFILTSKPLVTRLPIQPSISHTEDTSIDDDAINNIPCRILLLDHLNINHQKGQHDALKAFYFDFLRCTIDPRKYENYVAGSKTIWANVGMHQFHLPEGKPDAQVLEGVITLVHENCEGLIERYSKFLDGDDKFASLQGTEFHVDVERDSDNFDDLMLMVTDPWGNEFCILPTDDAADDRAEFLGSQPNLEDNLKSEGLKLEDLTIYVSHGSNLEGIARFYQKVFGATSVEELETNSSISIAIGDRQMLTFMYHPGGAKVKVQHHDLSFDEVDEYGNPSNFGPHISMYVTNLSYAYRMADELNVAYVNPRFKRRAYTEDEAIDQCMFRILDIVDPLDQQKNVIISLEHEVRSTTTRDGKKYKSCPLINVDL